MIMWTQLGFEETDPFCAFPYLSVPERLLQSMLIMVLQMAADRALCNGIVMLMLGMSTRGSQKEQEEWGRTDIIGAVSSPRISDLMIWKRVSILRSVAPS